MLKAFVLILALARNVAADMTVRVKKHGHKDVVAVDARTGSVEQHAPKTAENTEGNGAMVFGFNSDGAVEKVGSKDKSLARSAKKGQKGQKSKVSHASFQQPLDSASQLPESGGEIPDAAAEEVQCIGGWKLGKAKLDGHGHGKIVKIFGGSGSSNNMPLEVATREECATQVKEKCIAANAVMFAPPNKPSAGCHCIFGMIGQEYPAHQPPESCQFHADPMCVGGWKAGSPGGADFKQVASAVSTIEECKTLCEEQYPGCAGMRVKNDSDPYKQACECQVESTTQQNPNTPPQWTRSPEYSHCKFPSAEPESDTLGASAMLA